MKAGEVWHLESSSLPGLSVGDVVAVDVAEGEYAFFPKPDVARAATLPVSTTKEDVNSVSR